MGDKKDPSIEAQDFCGGVKVVDIGDIRVARGLSRRPYSSCQHRKMLYDGQERRIWCSECETNIEPFEAFKLLVEKYHNASADLVRRTEEVEAAEKAGVISLAAQAIDKVWRSRRMVPVCPSCRQGLFPEDFKHGVGMRLGREYAEAKRRRAGKPLP